MPMVRQVRSDPEAMAEPGEHVRCRRCGGMLGGLTLDDDGFVHRSLKVCAAYLEDYEGSSRNRRARFDVGMSP